MPKITVSMTHRCEHLLIYSSQIDHNRLSQFSFSHICTLPAMLAQCRIRSGSCSSESHVPYVHGSAFTHCHGNLDAGRLAPIQNCSGSPFSNPCTNLYGENYAWIVRTSSQPTV
ncbi:hypothetical protein DPMN_149122 [Dreissena polymorpha]|uniref:Uncharacterized protein n=1 Tax=Dreissena polymorpha TaxID=45954 RepID=A0A9D4FDT2_DREPO|nr:hypothetical protein DPMN_149122 [Dreissena polymorpha]